MSFLARTVLLTAVAAALSIAVASPLLQGEDDLGAAVEKALAAGDEPGAEALLKGRPYEVIFVVDGNLEGWLANEEKPAEQRDPKAAEMLERAVKIAALADRALGVKAYSRYANAWKGWSAAQRLQFREGQQLYGQARAAQKEKKYAEAAEFFQKSLAKAEPLDDLWGMAQAHQALGDLAMGEKKFDVAVAEHEKALELWSALRHVSMLRSCRALGQACEQLGKLDAAKQHLEQMLASAAEAGRADAKTTGPVHTDLARICRALGDEAAAKDHEEKAAAAAAATEPKSGN